MKRGLNLIISSQNKIAWTFCLIMAVITYVRLYFGISVGDEALTVTVAYFPKLGAHWFQNNKSITQMGSILFSPFVLTYGALVGTSGLILFVRHLHYVLSLIVAFQTFLLFRHTNAKAVALLLAACVFAFVPHSLSTLSYNNLGSLFFGLATVLAVRARIEDRTRLAFLSGLCWPICVFAYPTLLIPFLTFATMAVVRGPLKNLKSMALGLVSMGAVLACVLIACGVDNVWDTYQWSVQESHAGATEKLFYAAYLASRHLPPLSVVLASVTIWAVAGYFNRAWGAYAFTGLVALCFAFGTNFECALPQVLWPLFGALSLVFILQRRLWLKSLEWDSLALIVLPALVGSIVTCMTSRMTLYAMCISGVFGGLMLIALVLSHTRLAGWICALLLASSSVYYHWITVNEDGPMESLDTQVQSGPFAGLYTFSEKASWIETVQNALVDLPVHHGTIVIKDFFPAGYLMTDNAPLGPIVFFGPAIWYPEQRSIYKTAYSDKKFWPDLVFDLIYYPAQPDKKWPYNVANFDPMHDAFKNFFQNSGAYQLVRETTTYQLLRKK